MMKKKNSKRFTAIILAAALAVSSSMTIYANETDANETLEAGTEQVSDVETSDEMSEAEMSQTPEETEAEEDDAKEGVVQVVLPTSAVGIFDFILDPQELINQTHGAAYGGKKFEEGATLFFERTSRQVEEDYTSDSDAIAIANRGTTPVDVVVNANVSVSMADGLAMTDDREFTDDTRASLYLALTDGETIVPITFEEGATIQTVVPAAVADGESEHVYSFWLTGACNRKGDWYALKDMEIEVTVTWEVVPREEEILPEEPDEEETSDSDTLPASAPASSNIEATPSEATASDVDKNVAATPSEATASDAKKDVAAATSSDIPASMSPKNAAIVN